MEIIILDSFVQQSQTKQKFTKDVSYLPILCVFHFKKYLHSLSNANFLERRSRVHDLIGDQVYIHQRLCRLKVIHP